MPNADRTQAITEAVHRYIALIADGSARDLADLYADDATVEDPVGGEVHIGRTAIQGFYALAENVEKECELVSLRVAGSEAAFQFRLTITSGDGGKMRIEPIDVMAFDNAGKVTAMKAYWSAADVTTL
jgi:steroid Delta-isomerase